MVEETNWHTQLHELPRPFPFVIELLPDPLKKCWFPE